jgi:nucleoid-associated protein YgaU
MDVLKNKQFRKYEDISRYSSFPIYYNSLDEKYIYGITSQLSDKSEYVAHKVTFTDTLESLAFKYYGRPDLYWVIADFNRIQDPYLKLIDKFSVIKIPSLSTINFEV